MQMLTILKICRLCILILQVVCSKIFAINLFSNYIIQENLVFSFYNYQSNWVKCKILLFSFKYSLSRNFCRTLI